MLTFNLKKEWFEKIKRGEKTHEYREVKRYWLKRITKVLDKHAQEYTLLYNDLGGRTTIYIIFVCGYAPKEDKTKRLKAKLKDIKIINGKETDLKIDKRVFDIEFELI
jgi:hypothetical protein